MVVTARDDLSILTGQFRDRNTIYSAVTNMLGDPSFLLKNNSLRIVTDALKRCATPPQKMLYFWKKAFSLGVIVRRRELKDLLYYCYEHGRGDPITIVKALETACSLEKAIYWNSVLFNLIIQIYSERLDIKLAKKRAGLLLRDIVKDIIDNNIENVMDEKSLVMLLKYFSNAEDYEAAKLVFSFRNRAAKRPIDGETAAIDVEYVENVVVWNAYLTALTKIALKVNDSGENQFSVEINEILAAMIDLKIADFYTHCIMLEFNAGKIIANKRNNNNRRSEELVNSSLEMWDNSYFLKLRESNQPYKYIDDINKGLAISYAIIIRCLLHSADSANGVKSVSSVSSTSSTLTESKKAADNYVRIALKLSFEIPSSEVASSLLYSLGLAEESCEVAIKYMHMLIERCASMSKDESKIGSKKESDGEGNSKGGDNSVSGIETTVSAEGEGTFERRNEAQNKYSTKKHPKNNRAKKDIQSQGNLISTNVVESLLGGYYASNRNDLVIQAYLLAHDNLSNTISNSRQLNALKISELNIIGGTKAFNLFLVSVREMVKGGFIDARDKEPLWQFCKGVIKERVSAETARVNREKEGSSRGNEGNRDRSGENGGRSVVKSSSDVNLFDSYSTVISMDLANMVTDYTMSKELFYGYEASSQPLPRAVQTYLRAFQAPTQLFDLDKLVNTVLDQSPRYRAMFTSNTDLTGDDARTFDEMMNAYLRVGNLPIALEYAAKYSNKFSDSAMKNLLIRFDRFWRDYDNETVYIADLLKGENQ